MNVTMTDVGRLAGVSAMTVSRALSAPESVPAATAERVRAAAYKLGYVRNRLAGGLRTSKSHLVAAVLPTLSGTVFTDSLETLNTGLARHGYHLMVGQTGYTSQSQETELLEDVIGARPGGIVLTGTLHSAESRRLLLASGVPVLEMWDYVPHPIDMLVGFSHEAVGAAVTDYLVGKGRKRLAFIGAEDVRSRRRYAAFAKRAAELGLDAPAGRFVAAPARLGDGRRELAALLQGDPSADAVFCSSDTLANGVLIEARVHGIAVPERLGVVGFGDLNFAGDLEPALTTVRIDAPRIGALSADLIAQRLRGETPAAGVIDTGFSIKERASA